MDYTDYKTDDIVYVKVITGDIIQARVISDDPDSTFCFLATLLSPYEVLGVGDYKAGDKMRYHRIDIIAINGINIHTDKPFVDVFGRLREVARKSE